VAKDIRTIFNPSNRVRAEEFLNAVAQKYDKTFYKLAEWQEHNIPEGRSFPSPW
jgi:hypothetical protein